MARPLSTEKNGADIECEGAALRPAKGASQFRYISWHAIGPGLLVCLADTDAGCLIVAAQSGSMWGYSLLLLQVGLIPVLFMTQELTIRLAIHTQQGHVACIRQFYGNRWAFIACTLLVVECLMAMVSEMSGVAAVAELWGVHRSYAALGAAVSVVAVIFLCSYKQVEALGIFFGMFEVIFVLTMFFYHPSPIDVFHGATTFHSDASFLKLVAANVGAVVMPWMIYFQQSAIVARRIRTEEAAAQERSATLLGSVLTQLIMVGALVTLAAAHETSKNLETVADIVDALAPALGPHTAKVLVSLALLGGSLAAAFVVTLASSWAICDFLNVEDEQFGLDASPASAPAFYGSCVVFVLIGSGVLMTGVNIVRFNLFVELINGLLLPFTVFFLFMLVTGEALPPHARVVGRYKLVVAMIFFLCASLCVATIAFV